MHPAPRSPYCSLLRACVAAMSGSLVFPLVQVARAADGTWNTTTNNALWSEPGNWLDSSIADGPTSTAYFNNLDITAATTVNLDGARTLQRLYFGDTTAGGGSWILANNGNAANVLTLSGDATITVDAMASVNNTGSNVTISAVIAGTNGLTKNGAGANSTSNNNTAGTGTLTLAGANTYTGATNIQTGTIRATNSLAFGGVEGGRLATNVVNVSAGARLMLSNVNIANTVNLNGTNALAVAGGNGNLSGIVNLQSNSSAYVHNGGNYTLTFSGTLNLGDNVLTVQTTGSNNGALITGVLTGTGGITKNGAGPLTMSADAGGYSGTTSLMSGELVLGNDGALGTGTLVIAPPNNSSVTIRSSSSEDRSTAVEISLPRSVNNGNSSGVLRFGSATTGGLAFTNTTEISLGAAGRTFDVLSRTRFDAGFGATSPVGITKTGAATLVMNGASTYTGATTISAGTLQLGDAGATGSLSTESEIVNNSHFAVHRSNTVVQGVDFNSVISGTGAFSQTGAGTTILTGANTYTGDTNVDAGTLLVNGSLDAASVVNVNNGGRLGGLGSAGNVTFNEGAALAYHLVDASQGGDGLSVASLTGAGLGNFTVYLTGAGVGFDGAVDRQWTVLTSADSLTLGSIVVDTTGFAQAFGGSFTVTADTNAIYLNYVANAIPEPAAYATFAGVVFMMFAASRRRRRG